VERKEEDELVTIYLVCLNLVEHCLGLLEQNKGFLVLLLTDKVKGTFIELINDHRNLVLLEIEVFVVKFFKGVFKSQTRRVIA